MKRYEVRRLPEGEGRLALAGAFEPERLPECWLALEEARIDAFPWDRNGYRPDARARVGWNEGGLHVLMMKNEPTIRCEVTQIGGACCTDSCLEFFFAPFEGKGYWNFELTPRAVAHIGYGAGREGRDVCQTLPEGVSPVASRHEGGFWAVSYTVPMALIRARGGEDLRSGLVMRGNFYECGGGTEHYGMWQPYELPRPDFHRPERFAELTLA